MIISFSLVSLMSYGISISSSESCWILSFVSRRSLCWFSFLRLSRAEDPSIPATILSISFFFAFFRSLISFTSRPCFFSRSFRRSSSASMSAGFSPWGNNRCHRVSKTRIGISLPFNADRTAVSKLLSCFFTVHHPPLPVFSHTT